MAQSDLMSNHQIIETVTMSIRDKYSHLSELATPSLEQIQAFTAEAPDNEWVVFVVLAGPRGSRYDVRSIDEDTKNLELARRIMLQRSTRENNEMSAEEQIWAMANILHNGTTPGHLRQHFYKVDPAHFEPIANFIKRTAGEPTPERLQWLHKTWEGADEDNPDMKISHPLAPIILAWGRGQGAKHITREYDRQHPVSLIDKSILGSVRDVVLDVEGDGNLPIITEQIPELQQLELWESEDPLPLVLPWSRLLWDGISLQTKAGAVSHGVSIADEVFMELDTGEWEGTQRWELGTLLRTLHPNLSEKQLTSNRKKYLTYVIRGIHQVQNLGWKVQMDGGLYLPIKIPQRLMPMIESPDDFTVVFEVAIPTAGDTGYMMVEKDVIRRARKKSANQLNATKTSYWLIDTYGTGRTKEGKGYIIDPEAPKYYHDDDGNVRHPDTQNIIYDQKGRPLKDPYKPHAVRQLPRDENKSKNRYRVLSPEQRIRAVYPDGYPQKMRKATALKRADKAFDALAQADFFRIEKLPEGWRIMPSDSHVKRYRGVRRASEKSK